MLKKKDFLIIFMLWSVSAIEAVDEFPEFYHVEFTNPDFQHLVGYYKKEDTSLNNRPILKKPRLISHLSLDEDGKWKLERKKK